MADRSVLVRLRADISDYNRGLMAASASTRAFVKELDSSNNQTSMLIQSLMAIAPALVPIGGAATVAVTSLASSLSFTAGAGITAVLAFQGVGDALGALNEYQLEPSAENMAKLKEELDKLGPAGADFVVFLQEMRPEMQRLQDVAQEGMFPGMQEGLTSVMEQLPIFERLIGETANAMGVLAADTGDALTNDFWTDFFNFLADEAAPSIDVFFRSLGKITEAMAAMWMAFEPINTDFAEGMLSMMERFAQWAHNLDDTQGFEDFINYIRETGPAVLETLGSLGNAFVQLIQAAAPLGGPTLQIIQFLADTISLISNSPAGTVLIGVAAGLAAVSRAVALYNIANGSALAQFIGKTGADGKKAIPGIRGAAAALGILVTSMTDVDEKMGLSNTATLGFMGTLGGPWGAAAGAAIGLTMDLAAANNDLTDAIGNAHDAARGQDMTAMEDSLGKLRDELGKTDEAIRTGMNADPLINLFSDDTDYDNLGEFALGQLQRRVEGIRGMGAAITAAFSGEDEKAAAAADALERHMADVAGGAGDVSDVFTSALAPSLGLTAEEFDLATLAADEFVLALEDVNAMLSRRASMRDYQAALDEFTAGLDPEKNGLDKNIRRETGRANIANLDAIGVTALKVAENLKGLNRIEFLRGARKDFLDAAKDLEVPTKAAERLANKLFGVDEVDPTVDVDEKGADKTKNKLDEVKRKGEELKDPVQVLIEARDHASGVIGMVDGMLQRLDGDDATVTVTTNHQEFWSTVMKPPTKNAAGNIYREFAAGDVANAHQPMIAAGSKDVRIWAEEETQGESYIPHANDWRRPRAVKIWEETGRILGVQFQKFAAGGTRPSYSTAPPPAPVVNVQAAGPAFPSKVQLVVGGRVFDAHVRQVADGAVADRDSFQDTLERRGH